EMCITNGREGRLAGRQVISELLLRSCTSAQFGSSLPDGGWAGARPVPAERKIQTGRNVHYKRKGRPFGWPPGHFRTPSAVLDVGTIRFILAGRWLGRGAARPRRKENPDRKKCALQTEGKAVWLAARSFPNSFCGPGRRHNSVHPCRTVVGQGRGPSPPKGKSRPEEMCITNGREGRLAGRQVISELLLRSWT